MSDPVKLEICEIFGTFDEHWTGIKAKYFWNLILSNNPVTNNHHDKTNHLDMLSLEPLVQITFLFLPSYCLQISDFVEVTKGTPRWTEKGEIPLSQYFTLHQILILLLLLIKRQGFPLPKSIKTFHGQDVSKFSSSICYRAILLSLS